MPEFDPTVPSVPETHITPETNPTPDAAMVETPPQSEATVPVESAPVNPVRAAAGRLGGRRVHRLAELGREYEKEHGLTPGRQRRKQLIQLGRRYEVEHGLRKATPPRNKKSDPWQEFLAALARIVKPQYRPVVEELVATLRTEPKHNRAA
jgi:hypothetical protein